MVSRLTQACVLILWRLLYAQALNRGQGGWKFANSNEGEEAAVWSTWHGWQACSVTCGDGEQARVRACVHPRSFYVREDSECGSHTEEQRDCSLKTCPVDGKWADWSAWEACSKTCETGYTSRARTCTNPAPAHRGKDCDGVSYESQECIMQEHCPIDGAWGAWSEWDSCPVTCGKGNNTRSRSCDQPLPQHGGKACEGDSEEVRDCLEDLVICPVHGEWTDWTQWSSCSVTCSHGNNTRSRSCDNPAPDHGGDDCEGDSDEWRDCVEDFVNCPIDGGWGDWTTWSPCSATCESGEKTRSRNCDNPQPQHNGQDCPGDGEDDIVCVTEVPKCPEMMATSNSIHENTLHSYIFDGSPSIFHSGHPPSINDWLQIDFLEPYPFYGVVVEARYDYYVRFYSFQVKIGNQITQGGAQKITWNYHCGTMTENTSQSNYYKPRNWPILCPGGPINGRYVTIQRTFTNYDYNEVSELHVLLAPKPGWHTLFHSMYCFYIVDFRNGDLGFYDAADPWQCLEKCKEISDCDSFTWLNNVCIPKKYSQTTAVAANIPFRNMWSGRIVNGNDCRGFNFNY